jgi:hypothetical protein
MEMVLGNAREHRDDMVPRLALQHHKTKQAPDGKVDQPASGVTRWKLPSGRTHSTTPTVYNPA